MNALLIACAAALAAVGQPDSTTLGIIGLPGGTASFELLADGTIRAEGCLYRLLLGGGKAQVDPGSWRRLDGWLPIFESQAEAGGVAYQCRLLSVHAAGGALGGVVITARNVHLARRQATVWLEPLGKPGPLVWRADEGPSDWAEPRDEGSAFAWQVTLERGREACLTLKLAGPNAYLGEPDERQHSLERWRDAVEAEGIVRTPDANLNVLWKRSLVRLLLADSQARAEAEKQAREAAQSSEAEAAPAPGAPTGGEVDLAEAAGTAARIKAMLVREQGEELHLFAGIPGEWLALGKMTYVAQLPTRWGKISCFLKAKQGWGQVVIYPPLGARPQALVLHAPVGFKIAKAVADGRPQPVEGGEAVRLPPDAHLVQLTWASEAGQDGQEAPQASGKQG